MLHPSTKRLIDTLGERTRQKKVEWAESDSGSITHDTEGYRVEITPEPHTIFLLDALGKELDKVEPHEYDDATDDNDRPYSQFVSELFREAHRHARGTERAIELLLAGLADVDESAAEGVPENVPEIVDATAEPEATFDETNTLETLPETQAEEASLEPDVLEAEQEPHVEEATLEPQAEDVQHNNIWPAAALATNGLAVMNDDEPTGNAEEPIESPPSALDFIQPETSDSLAESITAPEPLVSEEVARPLTDIPSDIAPLEGSFELQEENTPRDIDTPSEPSIPEPLGSIMRFTSEPITQAEDVTSFEGASETVDPITEDIPASYPTNPALSDNTIDRNDTAQDRLAGFAPVDIDEPGSAYVPDDTSTETHEPIKQTYSLSGIGAGFGLGAAPSVIASLQDTAEDATEEPFGTESETMDDASESASAFIDGTMDLPDTLPSNDDDVSAEAPLAATLETFEDTHTVPTDQIDEETSSRGETSGIFTGILQRGRSAVEKVQDTIEDTEEAAHKVIDDLADDDTAEDDIKPKTTPRFNPWN